MPNYRYSEYMTGQNRRDQSIFPRSYDTVHRRRDPIIHYHMIAPWGASRCGKCGGYH